MNQPVTKIERVDCPVCGPSTYKIWMNDGKLTQYVSCLKCGTVYASPRLAPELRFEWLDSTFGLGQNAFENAASRSHALAMEAKAIQQFVNSGSVLDIGCDLGDLFQWFRGPQWQRLGVEISPSAAAYASEKYDAHVFPGTLHEAAYPANSVDLVTMIDMFYYVDDPLGYLFETARILKPGGILALEFPGQSWTLLRNRGLLCFLLDRRWARLHTDSSYLFFSPPNALVQLLTSSGFEILEFQPIPSPITTSKWRNLLSLAYFRLFSALLHLSKRVLTWAPKYLILARLNISEQQNNRLRV